MKQIHNNPAFSSIPYESFDFPHSRPITILKETLNFPSE